MTSDPQTARIAELEARIAALTQQNLAAQRELESFTYAVSHDLRAPLRSLSGFSQALQESLQQGDSKTQHYLLRIQEASRKLSELIDALLGLSRLSRAEMHPRAIDFTQLCEELAHAIKAKQSGRIISITVSPGMTVCADPRLLRAAVEALLDNAVKFTASRTPATIEIGRTAEAAFFISDNGVGFDMAYVDKLFRPFQRLHADSEFSGLGIGLAGAQRVVARHNGHIWLKSMPTGTTAFFTLDARQGTPAPAQS